MLLLLVLYVYICYRWTRRVAARTAITHSKGWFIATVCLKMLLRMTAISFVLVAVAAAISAVNGPPGVIEAGSSRGAAMGMAVAILGSPINLLIAVVVSLNVFRERSIPSTPNGSDQLKPIRSATTPPPIPSTAFNALAKRSQSVALLIFAGAALFVLGALIAIFFVRSQQRSTYVPATASPQPSQVAAKSQLLRGHELAYSIEVPATWTVKKGPAQFDAFATSKSVYVGVIAEAANLGSADVIADIARRNLASEGTDLDATQATPVLIDGRQWLGFTAKCRVDRIPAAYQFYVYAGPEGTFQLVGWTTQNLFDQQVENLRRILQTFRFPEISTALSRNEFLSRDAVLHPPDSSGWRKISGREYSYSIRIPPDWERKNNAQDFDLIVGREATRVGIVAEAGNVGGSQVLADIARRRITEAATEVGATSPQRIVVDGRPWLEFVVKCKVDNVPFAYQFYVYAGPEGSYQIIGWTIQNLFERDAPVMRVVMQSFTFEAK